MEVQIPTHAVSLRRKHQNRNEQVPSVTVLVLRQLGAERAWYG
jgi:hypothetical protein